MRWYSLTVFMLLGVLAIACTPAYPKCDKDSHCPGNKDGKEFCVNNLCQECRPGQNDCGAGKECRAGRCEVIAGYCMKNADCPGNLCVNNRCAACKTDSQCPGGRCSAGTCIAENRTRCKSNDDCAESEDCIGGFCEPANKRAASGTGLPGCTLEPVYFDFNESVLSAEATSIIDRNAECLRRGKRAVVLVGHTDPRGTQEYNLALSERRAQSVKERLGRLGAAGAGTETLPRGELDSTGTDETGWSRDRRVEFKWK